MSYYRPNAVHRTRRVLCCIAVVLGVLTAATADAFPWRPQRLPSTPALDEPGMNFTVCNTCHTTGGGTPRNPFGLAWEAAYPAAQDLGLTAAQAFAAVANLDSDR